jgi:hypothetical protein
VRRHVHHRQVGDDAVDHAHAGQRQRALRQDLQVEAAVLLLGHVLHQHDDALDAGHQVHRAAHALDHLAGIIQLARSPFSLTCMAPRMDRLILPPRIIAKLSGCRRCCEPGSVGDGLLAGVDEVGVDLVLGREGADAEHAVLALQPDLDVPAGTWLATSVGMPMPRLT